MEKELDKSDKKNISNSDVKNNEQLITANVRNKESAYEKPDKNYIEHESLMPYFVNIKFSDWLDNPPKTGTLLEWMYSRKMEQKDIKKCFYPNCKNIATLNCINYNNYKKDPKLMNKGCGYIWCSEHAKHEHYECGYQNYCKEGTKNYAVGMIVIEFAHEYATVCSQCIKIMEYRLFSSPFANRSVPEKWRNKPICTPNGCYEKNNLGFYEKGCCSIGSIRYCYPCYAAKISIIYSNLPSDTK